MASYTQVLGVLIVCTACLSGLFGMVYATYDSHSDIEGGYYEVWKYPKCDSREITIHYDESLSLLFINPIDGIYGYYQTEFVPDWLREVYGPGSRLNLIYGTPGDMTYIGEYSFYVYEYLGSRGSLQIKITVNVIGY